MLATGRSIGWVVCAGDIFCKHPTQRGCQEVVDSPESGVGGCVPAPALFPTFDNSLIVAMNREWRTGLVECEQGTNEKLECDALCPPDVSLIVLPVFVESPCAPPVSDDDRQAVTGAGIREGSVVDCERVMWDWNGGFGA